MRRVAFELALEEVGMASNGLLEETEGNGKRALPTRREDFVADSIFFSTGSNLEKRFTRTLAFLRKNCFL